MQVVVVERTGPILPSSISPVTSDQWLSLSHPWSHPGPQRLGLSCFASWPWVGLKYLSPSVSLLPTEGTDRIHMVPTSLCYWEDSP